MYINSCFRMIYISEFYFVSNFSENLYHDIIKVVYKNSPNFQKIVKK